MLKIISCRTRVLQINVFNFVKNRYLYSQTPVCCCILKQNIKVKSVYDVINNDNRNINTYLNKNLFSTTETQSGTLTKNEFESKCNETLDSLCEYFEEIIESSIHLKGCDVAYSDGVLTIHFGNEYGTYVINRQTPNHQIWLSSPTSGPKRYDFVVKRNTWIYKHDNRSLHELLQKEIPKIVKVENVNFFNCANAG